MIKDFVTIPKDEYDALMELKRIYEFQPTAGQKKTLAKARKNRKGGKVLTLGELKQSLGLTN